jgi:ATP-dependent DNA helicase RecG
MQKSKSQHFKNRLITPIQYVKELARGWQNSLRKGIRTVEDALFPPRCYEDRRNLKKISELKAGQKETGFGEILLSGVAFYQNKRKRVFEVVVGDGSGVITLKWFHGNERYLRERFKKGRKMIFSGEVRYFNLQKEIHHPDVEIVEGDIEEDYLNFKRIVPIYSETEGLHQRTLRRLLRAILEGYSNELSSPMPREILHRQNLIDFSEAFGRVHFPPDEEPLELLNLQRSEGHRRIIFDEFFFLELGMALKRRGMALEPGISFQTRGVLAQRLLDLLSFQLTRAQQKVWDEIREDLGRAHPMNRLIQGDVGSGKTVVALLACLYVIECGYQAAIMAPTEVLAEQHYLNLHRWVEPLGVQVALLTSNIKGSEKEDLYQRIKKGEVQLVIGTHAVIQEAVEFHQLGLAIIDEQHKFGVVQRGLLKKKGANPDVLVMTATPIPRTLAMTIYGDLDVSLIDEMPPGRMPVETKVYPEPARPRVYRILEEEVRKGRQVFIVYPLVEESEKLQLRDATRMAEQLQREVFPEFRIGLLHGRMKSEEKEAIMMEFKEGRFRSWWLRRSSKLGSTSPMPLSWWWNMQNDLVFPTPSVEGENRQRSLSIEMYLACSIPFFRRGKDSPPRYGADHRWISDCRGGSGSEGPRRILRDTAIWVTGFQGGPYPSGCSDSRRSKEGSIPPCGRGSSLDAALPFGAEEYTSETLER